jgi:hypothetical protein
MAALRFTPAQQNGTMVAIVGRRTHVVHVDNLAEAARYGVTPSELAAWGITTDASSAANAVMGVARDEAAEGLPDTRLQIRDLWLGSVVNVTKTNAAGQFAFRGLARGTYVVEMVAPNGSVLAVSDTLTVEARDIVQTVVQMSGRTRSFMDWMNGATRTAVNSAADSGVLAIEPRRAASPES